MIVEKFSRELHKDMWDEFVRGGKNKSFLFYREFMDYHSDRFLDSSYMVYDEKGTLIALVPANISKQTPASIISHEGLTYGGVVVRRDVKLKTVMGIFYHFLKHLHQNNIESFQLKQIPAFYNSTATDEIEYVMFLLGASLFRRDVAFVVDQSNKINCSGNIRRESEKAKKGGAVVKEEDNMTAFWEDILVPNLAERFGVNPVHSLSEINLLKKRFPDNIRQFSAFCGDRILAGATLFIEGDVVHSQYISSNEEGRKTGTLNYLFRCLIDELFVDHRYFDFGIVNEDGGTKINEGMLFWKESFGGRSMRHDFYNIQTNSFGKLEKYLV